MTDSFNKTKEAQVNNYVATLVPDASRARVEIEEFLGDNDMTNLYLLALEAMQKEDATKSAKNGNEDWWTFYSLSGIHGVPPERWNGILNPLIKGGNGSYCTHGMLVFPTWHRVYVNMFEQAVSNKVHDIASQYHKEPEKSIYQKAANRFRVPFWDPYLPRNKVALSATVSDQIWGFPKILGTEKVWVKRPNGTELEQMGNPLYSFKFPNKELSNKGRVAISWSNRGVPPNGSKFTIRSPDRKGNTDIYGTSPGDRTGLELSLQRQAKDTVTKLWKLLARYTDDGKNESRSWASFATHNLIDPSIDKPVLQDGRPVWQSDTAVSLESWHDTIHGLIGTGAGYGGHMGDPAIAGFDPIFWLHHCNVDRLLAIYQALYPDKWLEPDDASANLYPFRKNATEFWNSNDVRDWTTLGYAIPGNKKLDEDGRLALEKHLYEYYNWTTEGTSPPPSVSANWPRDLSTSVALYGATAKSVTNNIVQFEALEVTTLVTRTVTVPMQQNDKIVVKDQAKSIIITDSSAKTEANPPETIKDGTMLTWNAHIRVKKFAYNGSFNVHLFIGSINDSQTARFLTKKNEVGFSSIFATALDAPCANCLKQRESGLIYEDAVPVTPSLFAFLKSNQVPEADGPPLSLRTLESFEPEHVVPFLKENLNWRLTDMASNALDDVHALKDSGLQVGVSVRKFEVPTPEKPLGVYHPAQTFVEITQEKVGGLD